MKGFYLAFHSLVVKQSYSPLLYPHALPSLPQGAGQVHGGFHYQLFSILSSIRSPEPNWVFFEFCLSISSFPGNRIWGACRIFRFPH